MKAKMVDMWNGAAATYAEWVIEHQLVKGLHPNFEALLVPALQGRAGARILDIASASGEPAATLAAALPQATVLATDFVAPYLELGKARAARLGLTNLQFEVADGEDLHHCGDASCDALTCSLGLMFMPRYRTALAEFARVLKPGGIFAATVWQAEERVPFFHLAREVAAEYDTASAPSAGSSIAVRFGEPAELLEAIKAALGGAGVTVDCRALDLEFTMAPGLWWKEALDMPLPIKAAVTKAQEQRPGEDVFEEAKQSMKRRLLEKGWLSEDEALCVPGNGCWFISAVKP